jgi:hypothetical protein
MRTLLGTLLGVIAVGVLLIAYGLLGRQTAAAGMDQRGRALLASERIGLDEASSVAASPQLLLRCEPGQRAVIRQVAGAAAGECVDDARGSSRPSSAYVNREARPVQVSDSYQVSRPTPIRVERSTGRDWKKTAMVIGGSSAAGAGLGGIFGGKKGALIGAAIGGGAGTLFEVKNR